MTSHRNGVVGHVGFSAIVVLGVALAASAAPLEFVAGNAASGFGPLLFDAAIAPQGEWAMDNVTVSDGTVLEAAPGSRFLTIAPTGFSGPGALTWTGNPLLADNSVGGQADGAFGAGGAFVLTGKLFENFVEIFDGVLISGSISAFSAVEPTPGSNFIDLGDTAILTPVGGALVDGSQGLTMPTDYLVGFTAAMVTQNGGNLIDFQNNIRIAESFQFTLVAVPEPAALLLMAGAGLAICRRRR